MACPKGKNLWRYLQRLHLLLQRLDQPRRQKILKSLSEAQRRDLERWMLQNRSEKMPKTVATRRKRGSREGRGVVSRRRNGGTRHFAVVVVHRLELRTREVESLVVAMRHHAVLVKLKEEISVELCHQRMSLHADEALGSRLLSKVRCVLESFQLHEDDLGLYFRAVSPIIGTCLCGPVFHLRTFHRGIAGWQFLQLARGVRSPATVEELQVIWDRSRRAISELWEVAGRSPTETAKRLDDLERRSFDGSHKRRAMQQRQEEERQSQQRLEDRAQQLLSKFEKVKPV